MMLTLMADELATYVKEKSLEILLDQINECDAVWLLSDLSMKIQVILYRYFGEGIRIVLLVEGMEAYYRTSTGAIRKEQQNAMAANRAPSSLFFLSFLFRL